MTKTFRSILSNLALKSTALIASLACGIAPAFADYRGGYFYDDGPAYVDERVPRGCGPRARAAGFCYGERIDPYEYEERRLDRRSERRRRFEERMLEQRAEDLRLERLAEERRIERERAEARKKAEAKKAKAQEKARRKKRDDDNDLEIALGIAGLAAGALIIGSLATRDGGDDRGGQLIGRVGPNGELIPLTPDYGVLPQARTAPQVLPRANGQPFPDATFPDADSYPAAPNTPSIVENRADLGGTLEPWSRAWLDACKARYRSFNPETGTFRGYDGLDHFCRPKTR